MRLKICTIVILLMTGVGQLHATDYYLSTTGTGTGTGGWGNAAAGASFFTSIAGTTLPAGTHIYIKAGSYSYTVTAPIYLSNNDVSIQGGFPTTATGTDLSGYNPVTNAVSLSFAGPNSNEVIAFKSDGTGSASNIIEVKGLQMPTSLPNLTFFGGGNNDGGIYKFTDLSFNYISSIKGAFVLDGLILGGLATFTNCYFSNANSNGGPGAINGGSAIPFSVIHCTFYSCVSSNAIGGSAITSSYPGAITLANSNFCMNYLQSFTAVNGGGGVIAAIGNGSTTFNVSNCIFSGNFNNSGGGAAVSCNNGVLHITNSQFLSNVARSTTVGGGAIFMSHSIGGNTISNCLFNGNGCTSNRAVTAGDGNSDGPSGGAINIGYDNTDFTISNCKFIGNTTSFGSVGGAIILYNEKGTTATIKNCYFQGNYNYNNNFSTVGSDIIAHGAGAGYGLMNLNTDTLQVTSQSGYTDFGKTSTTGYSFSGINIFGNPFVFSNTPSYTCPTYSQTVVLPITLTSFSGLKTNTGNLLTWQAENANNFSYFNVQRKSSNGDFVTIAKVDEGSNYSFLDNNPANGINYYRLAMVDKDGSIAYSKTLAIANTSSGFIVQAVYPNPASNYVTVETFSATGGNMMYQVKDASGKTVMQMTFISVPGLNKHTLNIANLAPGMYVAKIIDSDGSSLTGFKIIKQ